MIEATADARIAELEQQIANIKASRDCQVTIAAGEEERARKAEAERDELRTWTKKVTGTISNAIGGGSEMFNRHGEEYRIDPDFVDGFIRQRRMDYHDAMHRHVRIKNDLTTRAESAEVKLADAVKVIEQIAAVPAWGAPDRWDTTPAEVRQLARSVLNKIAKGDGQ
jgi:hypothetical protein